MLRRHRPNTNLARDQDFAEGNLDEPRYEARTDRRDQGSGTRKAGTEGNHGNRDAKEGFGKPSAGGGVLESGVVCAQAITGI